MTSHIQEYGCRANVYACFFTSAPNLLKNSGYDELIYLIILKGLELDRFLKLQEKSRTGIKCAINFWNMGAQEIYIQLCCDVDIIMASMTSITL